MYWTNIQKRNTSIPVYDCILMTEENLPLLIARVYETDSNRFLAVAVDYYSFNELSYRTKTNNIENAMDLAKEKAQLLAKEILKQKKSNKVRLKTIEQILEDIKPNYNALIKNGYISINYNDDMLWHISLSHLELLGKEVEVKEENDLEDYTHIEVKTKVPLHKFWFVKGNK